MSRRWFLGIWIAIVVLATSVRLWQLGSLPVSLYWDEIAMLVDLKAVTSTGQDMHGRPWYQVIYPSYGDFKLPMYLWSAEVSAKILGVSEFSLRLPNVFAGVITVIMAGWLSRLLVRYATQSEYSSRNLDQIQLWVMFVITISPWSIVFSRTAFEGHLGQALLTASIALLVWSLAQSRRFAFWVVPVLGAAATYSYFSVRFVWPVVYILISTLVIAQLFFKNKSAKIDGTQNRKTLIANSIQVIAGLALFVALILPVLSSPLAKQTDQLRLSTKSVLNNDAAVLESNLQRELAGNTRIDRVLYHRAWIYGRELGKNYSDNLSLSFLFLTGDPNLRHGTSQHGLFLSVMILGFIAGVLWLLKKHLPLTAVLSMWWILSLLPASVPEETPHALRSLNALTPIAIIIGIGCWWLWQASSTWQSQYSLTRKIPVVQLAFGVIIALSFIQFWLFYTSIYPTFSAEYWQSGYKPLAIAAFAKSAEMPVYISPPDDRFYLWLMGYGPFNGQEFRTWTAQGFKFLPAELEPHMSHIYLKENMKAADILLLLNSQPVISLAGRTEFIRDLCTDTSFHCEVETLDNEVGQPTFNIAKISRLAK